MYDNVDKCSSEGKGFRWLGVEVLGVFLQVRVPACAETQLEAESLKWMKLCLMIVETDEGSGEAYRILSNSNLLKKLD